MPSSSSSSTSILLLATFIMVSIVMMALILCQPGALGRFVGLKQHVPSEVEKQSVEPKNNTKARVGSTPYDERHAIPLYVVLCCFALILILCTLMQNIYYRIFKNKYGLIGYNAVLEEKDPLETSMRV